MLPVTVFSSCSAGCNPGLGTTRARHLSLGLEQRHRFRLSRLCDMYGLPSPRPRRCGQSAGNACVPTCGTLGFCGHRREKPLLTGTPDSGSPGSPPKAGPPVRLAHPHRGQSYLELEVPGTTRLRSLLTKANQRNLKTEVFCKFPDQKGVTAPKQTCRHCLSRLDDTRTSSER